MGRHLDGRRPCSRSPRTSRPRSSTCRPASRTTGRRCTAASRPSSWLPAQSSARGARCRRGGARAAHRALLHRRAAQLGHEQLGDHQAPHRRRSARLRLLRTDPRHRGGDAARRWSPGDWDDVAARLATEWENRKRLAPGVTHAGDRRADCARSRPPVRRPPRCAARAAAAACSAWRPQPARPMCARRSRMVARVSTSDRDHRPDVTRE